MCYLVFCTELSVVYNDANRAYINAHHNECRLSVVYFILAGALFRPSCISCRSLCAVLQTEYFGLRYVDRRLQLRWVDLDGPLKKQLDKHAESPLLYFGVMYYVNNVLSIQDPMAR